jgi:hypothetical protein
MNTTNNWATDASAAIILKVRQAQIEQLYKQTWGGLAGVLVIAFTACVILWQVVAHWKLELWAGSVATLSIARVILIAAFQRAAPTGADVYRWARLHVIGVVVSGVLWAMPALYLWPENSPVYQLIWPVCILPLASVAVAAYCTWTASYLSYLILSAVPVSLRLLAEGGLAFSVLGLLGLFFTVILARTGKVMHEASVSTLVVGLRNQALSAVLSDEKAKVDELNAQLQLEVTERAYSQQQLGLRNQELERALGNVKQLSGLLPICGSCKKIRNDKGYWEQIEAFIRHRSEAQFSHGICPDCAKRQFPDLFGEL